MSDNFSIEKFDGPDWEGLFDALDAIDALVVADEEEL
jgi:hypothetical protein